ncbi:MAG: cell division protein SepF [Candidatus Diapherotrites archaeon]|nr:cell division protein SepF [Candidatus Diapherotrites archaeon]
MSLLKNLLVTKQEDINMEEFLNNLDVEDEVVEDADAYVKPMNLNEDIDVTAVLNEARQGNIVLLNIADLSKRNSVKLRELVGKVRDEVLSINGDIARISPERVLVTPSRVKIVKKRK